MAVGINLPGATALDNANRRDHAVFDGNVANDHVGSRPIHQ
jgi:hypothetical protein